ncbi:putative lactose permease [Phaeomoniella chlamydospora]|uniref:Putative lactose permease n=1 Tax=Phaeomoniella chlamydospora TaxID=158046 RepID=A0A0G2GP92_PHACM|nr:putative lactose permease [Phaeomoniella chlamydospora]
MADFTEKPGVAEYDVAEAKPVGNVKQVTAASVALASAVEAQKPSLFHRSMWKLWFILSIGYIISTLNGFDSSLMGSINSMTSYQKSFGLSGAGSSTGIVFIIYNLGQIAAFPFCGMIADGYGRRICIVVGCVIVLIGTAVQTTCHTLSVFMGGRFILGMGAAIASAAGPAYTVELAHPAYRGVQAGMYNNFWWVGNILAGWATYGSNKNLSDSSWAWRTPTVVQCLLPSITMAMVMFFPESPRWLIQKDRREEALAIFAKYHTKTGDPNDPIVQLEYQEVIEQMNAYRNENPWYDFREFYNTRAARYRISMVICMAFFGQWSGNNVVSYFLPQMIKQAGITSPNKQLLINAINPIFSMIGAVYGATLLDKLGRRKMLVGGLLGGLVSYILLTAFTAQAFIHPHLSYGVIVSIYLFGIFFAWGWTPLQTLYAVECLTNRTRAKGSGLNYLFLNVAMVVNTYGISVGMDKIGWKLYLVYIAWIVVELVVIYFFFVETAGKTLEELESVFQADRPVKESLKREKVQVDDVGHVLKVEDA